MYGVRYLVAKIAGNAIFAVERRFIMSIPATASGEVAVRAASNGQDHIKPADEAHVSVSAKAKAELNVSIVQASLSVSIASGNEPLALIYKTAITSINEELKAQFGEDAIQNAASQDNTPEATASRIVALSTAFYDTFRKQAVGKDEAQVLKTFLDTLRGGVDRGFKEARGILEALKVLDGDIATNIDKTYALVQKGFADFEAAHSAAPAEAEAA
jgi:hypothetical protein